MAGESHGPALVGTLEGLPAGVSVTSDAVREALARRRLGYGRGARMSFEQDEVTFLGGVRHGLTQGGPIAIMVGNTEWPKWETVMSADPVDPAELTGARGAPLTRPRPGHAELVGMTKYGFEDARPVLERASARETAARVALGAVAEAFLKEAAGIELVAHTVQVGAIAVPDDAPLPPATEACTMLRTAFETSWSASIVSFGRPFHGLGIDGFASATDGRACMMLAEARWSAPAGASRAPRPG